jgi:hypothetical protein
MNNTDYLTIATNCGRKRFLKKNVVSCKGFSFGTRLSLINNKNYLMRESLEELNNLLDTGFFCRINSNTIINIQHIDAIFKNKLVLKNGEMFNIPDKDKERLVQEIKTVYAI